MWSSQQSRAGRGAARQRARCYLRVDVCGYRYDACREETDSAILSDKERMTRFGISAWSGRAGFQAGAGWFT